MANFVFKYLGFPENVQKEVLKSMEHMELFIFSTISTNTKSLVQSLKVRAHCLDVGVIGCLEFMVGFGGGTYFTLVLTDPRQEEQPPSPWPLILEPQNLTIKYRTAGRQHEETLKCRNPRYGCRNLINHLKSIFTFSRPSTLMFWDRELINVEDVWETFWDLLDEVVVNFWVHDVLAQRILEACISKTKKLILVRATPLSSAISIGQVVLQNLNVFTVNHDLDLDNLLLCNSSVVRTFSRSSKFINRFLHLWTRGSNRRLECIVFLLTDEVAPDMRTILKGVTYHNDPEEKVRKVKDNVRENMLSIQNLRVEEVRGGAAIRNKFGIVATVHQVRGENYNEVQMFVWN